MRVNHILFFLGLFFLTACGGSKTPPGIIPREKMVDLLVQVHIADGNMVTYTQVPDTLYKYGFARYLHLFKQYGTDTLQFKKSFMYYANQSVVFDKLYDDVIKALTAKNDSLNKVRINIVKQDSAKNAARTKAMQDSIKKAQAAKAGKGLPVQ